MSKTILIPKSLDLKYASLWHDGNHGKVPLLLKANWLKPLNERDERVFSTAIFMVMDMLADDGLIKQETIRKVHDKKNGWVDRSQITIGKAPIVLWLEIGFIVGALLTGGLQLIVTLVRHFL